MNKKSEKRRTQGASNFKYKNKKNNKIKLDANQPNPHAGFMCEFTMPCPNYLTSCRAIGD